MVSDTAWFCDGEDPDLWFPNESWFQSPCGFDFMFEFNKLAPEDGRAGLVQHCAPISWRSISANNQEKFPGARPLLTCKFVEAC
eukprot:1527780-Rhodomonas_salina.4